MGVGFGAAGVIESAHEAELFAIGRERFSGFTEDEFAVVFGAWEPAPLVESVLGFGEGHAVGSVDGAEAAGQLIGHFGAHGVKDGESQGHASDPFEERAAVELGGHW